MEREQGVHRRGARPPWTVRRRELMARPDVRRRAGRALVSLAAVGAVTALVGTVVAWRLLGNVNDATSDSLDVTIEALDSLEDTLDVAEELVGSTTTSLAAVEANLEALDESFTTGSAVVGDAGELTGSAEPALRNVAATLRQMESLGEQIDGLLVIVTSLPLAPDYNPDNGLGPTLGQLAEDLEPLPDAFGSTSDSLARFEESLATQQSEVATLAESLREVNLSLDGSQELLAGYRTQVAEARELAVGSRNDLDRDQLLLRLVLLVAGLQFALAQLVPLWLGWQLLDEELAATGEGATV
jgi:hypothetical protein